MKCSICEKTIPVGQGGWAIGNNAAPVNDGRCCDECNARVVIPARMQEVASREDGNEHWLYLMQCNGYCYLVGQDDNWTTAHQMAGDGGRLLAAAPDLLVALKGMVQRAESQLWSDPWLVDARRAIAKVEGHSNV